MEGGGGGGLPLTNSRPSNLINYKPLPTARLGCSLIPNPIPDPHKKVDSLRVQKEVLSCLREVVYPATPSHKGEGLVQLIAAPSKVGGTVMHYA